MVGFNHFEYGRLT